MLLSEHRPDLVVAESVIVEVKAIERLDKIHMAQMLTYLSVTGLRIGVVLNFNSAVLRHGVRRVIRRFRSVSLCLWPVLSVWPVGMSYGRRSPSAKVR
jgi:hypothetical protein